ncbi:hypothetical protein FRB94_001283 [Tulasnella sp. JGI-2019a]|nr:hypothetical protein FRB93_007828 [Tulasnella sp. JGI-2019a]KAG9013721.1 hypothetical protein FRB94_001283 [Tulasnella sp. JGI-2019a]KAG9037126.1 hypothetical protein FRB95_006680 [Tulasnella sp. JGI-2019a]
MPVSTRPSVRRNLTRANTTPFLAMQSSAACGNDDRRIVGYMPLIGPALLRHQAPMSEFGIETVRNARLDAARIVQGIDGRILVIVGPCSIHDPELAVHYAEKLRDIIPELEGLVVIMRAYFEKPRTTVGWKGFINDPDIDGSFDINKGLKHGRELLVKLTDMGVPLGTELLDTITPQYMGDTMSWGAIGARTTESQLHRELASGASFPVGFKNGTDGSLQVATDGMRSASHEHTFLGITEQGLAAIVKTNGNEDVHVILRGGNGGPNYGPEHIFKAATMVSKAGFTPAIIVDCSHGNSKKDYRNQPKVLESVSEQLEGGELSIVGVMIESNINEGRQDVPPEGPTALKYGVSITDGCVDWETTASMLRRLNQASLKRMDLVRSGKSKRIQA